ncbi:TPA: hypothetical protein ACIPUI_000912 [Citrobacter freundii]
MKGMVHFSNIEIQTFELRKALAVLDAMQEDLAFYDESLGWLNSVAVDYVHSVLMDLESLYESARDEAGRAENNALAEA